MLEDDKKEIYHFRANNKLNEWQNKNLTDVSEEKTPYEMNETNVVKHVKCQ